MPHGAAPQSPSPRLSEDKPFTYLRHVEKQRHIYVSHAAVSRAAAVVSNNTHQRTTKHPYRNACTLSQRAASLRMSFMYIPVLKLLSGYSSDLNEEKEEQARLT
jgi:hypothetical protein